MRVYHLTDGTELSRIEHQRTSVDDIIINAMDEDAITGEIEARLEDGYSTLKVKVGFDADDEVSLVLQGPSGTIVSPGANVTFLVEGRTPAVRIDGLAADATSRGPGRVTLRVPSGTHRIDIVGS